MEPEVRFEKGDRGFVVRTLRLGEIVVVRMSAWGFWDESTARRWREAAFAHFVGAASAGGKRWCVVVDNTRFPPQLDATRRAIGEAMREAVRLGMSRSAVALTNGLTKIELRRLAAESAMPGLTFHATEEEALRAVCAE